MGRKKGSTNKKVIVKVAKPTNFKSLEVKETKTEVFEVGISKGDIEMFLVQKAKKLSHFDITQTFESEKIVYDKKGNIFITLINPLDIVLPKTKSELINANGKSENITTEK